ncbi:Tv1425 protein [Plakobranchus ocellatus]|uniref:Tv1425 protein n=1 Tax=Plakobranchus ocellatus TaxID=259542 RepID=A0AAV4D2Y4_9GAST|nr:Tv1425 protein [Plakobranchus ocellatus]
MNNSALFFCKTLLRSVEHRCLQCTNEMVSRHLPYQCGCIHTTFTCLKKPKKEPSPEPYRFTTSNANMKSLAAASEVNENQGPIVALSLLVFLAYFLYFREENDLDEQLNVTLFERVPSVEEPHLAQAIPRMREKGEDTTEAEARLKELIHQRQEKERAAS